MTVTVPEEMAATLESWREDGRIESVSQFVTESVQQRMDRAESLAAIERVYGGRPPLEMVNQGRAMLGLPPLTDDEYGAGAA